MARQRVSEQRKKRKPVFSPDLRTATDSLLRTVFSSEQACDKTDAVLNGPSRRGTQPLPSSMWSLPTELACRNDNGCLFPLSGPI